MQCSECPYGEYDYARRVNIYDAIVAEHGIPNDVYGDMSRDEAIEQAEEYCWCDKVGGKAGHCSEVYEPDPVVKSSTSCMRKHNKRERDVRHQRHLKWLSENCSGYPIPVTLEDEIWISWV